MSGSGSDSDAEEAREEIVNPASIDWDDPPDLAVWAGDRMLAFELTESRSVTIDRDGDGGAEDSTNQEAANG